VGFPLKKGVAGECKHSQRDKQDREEEGKVVAPDPEGVVPHDEVMEVLGRHIGEAPREKVEVVAHLFY
jgi:hypothetical protein